MVYRDNPGVMIFEERNGHNGHVPGSEEDLKYLSLHPDIIEKVKHVRFSILSRIFQITAPTEWPPITFISLNICVFFSVFYFILLFF